MRFSRRDFFRFGVFLANPLMTNPWIRTVSDWTNQLNHAYDSVKSRVLHALGWEDPVYIWPYRGYGTKDHLYFIGRVRQDEEIHQGDEDTPVWRHLLSMYRRFESDEVPGARLQISFNGQTQEFQTNEEGFFRVMIQPEQPLPDDQLWHQAEVTVLEPHPKQDEVRITAEAIAPRSQAEFGIISDIDDTIVRTGATDLWRMIQLVYMGNAETRLPFPGVSKLYQALQAGNGGHTGNPIFYVSSSAWNMYDVFKRFMDIHEVPAGPLFLRDMELSLQNLLSFNHVDHKREQIDPLLQEYPDLPFILLGDSGQKDPETYRQVVSDYPGRILCIYIRNISDGNPERQQELDAIADQVEEMGSQLVAVPDTTAASEHAASQGWIQADWLASVKEASVG
jgi:phosphatidate phosphatase APP1